MFWFIAAIALFLITIAWFAFAPKEQVLVKETYSGRTETKVPSLKKYGTVPLALAILALVFSCFAIVGSKNVGVPTVFGKPTGDTYGAGLNFKAPWVSVTDIDATVQPEEYKGEDCIYVKISDGGTACVSLAYRWRVNPEGADTVFQDYRNAEGGITEAVRKALVSTNIKAAINEVFGAYDPLEGAVITSDMTPAEISNAKISLPDMEYFNEEIKKNVEKKIENLGDLIEIQSVTVSYLKMPDTTQDRINAFNAKVMDTKLAMQDIAIKKAQADANRELASSLQDPNVLVARCFDGLISGEITNEPGFSCWGVGGSVVIPGTKS